MSIIVKKLIKKMKKIIIGSVLLFGMVALFQTEVFSQERSINTYYNKMGVDNDGIHNIENLLLDNGIEQKIRINIKEKRNRKNSQEYLRLPTKILDRF